MTDGRLACSVLGLTLFGWALVGAAESRSEPAAAPLIHTRVLVNTVEVEREEPEVPTPIADSLVDWVELERQTACLWTLLQEAGVDITLEIVVAAGVWTDALGGACLVIGEDDGIRGQ